MKIPDKDRLGLTYSALVDGSITYKRLEMFKALLRYEHNIDHMNVDKIVNNGERWLEYIDSSEYTRSPNVGLMIARDDVKGAGARLDWSNPNVGHLPAVVYIKSTEMIDAIATSVHSKGVVWGSLFRQDNLEFLEHLDKTYKVTDDILKRRGGVVSIPMWTKVIRRQHGVKGMDPDIRQKMAQYIINLPYVTPQLKRMMVLCGFTADIKELSQIIIGATAEEITELFITYILTHIYASDRYKVECAMYLMSLAREPIIDWLIRGGLPAIRSIELLGCVSMAMSVTLDSLCVKLLSGKLEKEILLSIVQYKYYIEPSEGVTELYDKVLAATMKSVRVLIILKDVIDVSSILSKYNKDAHSQQIALGLAISKGELENITLKDYREGK